MSASQVTADGPEFPDSYSVQEKKKGIPSSILGVLIFIAAELMFFAALISAHSIISSAATEWPPADQPRLPVARTAVNTIFLLASAVTIFLGSRAFREKAFSSKSRNLLLASILLGGTFVTLQGVEWADLLSHGFTLQSTVYSSFFYLIIGSHGIHLVGALIALLRMFYKFQNRSLDLDSFLGHSIFWYFVVGIWPVLYVFVYL